MWHRLLVVGLIAMSVGVPRLALAQAPVVQSSSGGFIALSVRDLEASVKWYEHTLGLKRVMTVPRTGKIAGVVALEGPGLIVELIQHDDARPGSDPPELTHGIAKAGIIVGDFDRVVGELRSRGVVFENGPYPARRDVRANAMFTDNSGNVIQIFGPYAGR